MNCCMWVLRLMPLITVYGQISLFHELHGKAIYDKSVPQFDGRIVVSVPSEQKYQNTDKSFNLCVTSTRQVGFCTRLSDCDGFNIATLHRNICFMDIFVPGICCDRLRPPAIQTEIPSTTTSTTTEKVPPKENLDQSSVQSVIDESIKLENDSDKNCGKTHINPSMRIVNGDRSEEGRWPWMAALFANTFLGRKFHCGGSLISTRHVLTGAHCVKNHRGETFSSRQMTVRLGDSDISTLRDTLTSGRFYSVSEIRAHPEFQNINHYFLNDVAVLKLDEEIKPSAYIFPVCLPTPSIVSAPLDMFAGRYSTVTGYGRTELGLPSEHLLEAEVPIWKNEDCDNAYFAPITDIFICAGFKSGGIDACQGDSGGPLQIEEQNEWVQIGITSFGKGCGEPSFPGVYTRVAKFTSWIKENMT